VGAIETAIKIGNLDAGCMSNRGMGLWVVYSRGACCAVEQCSAAVVRTVYIKLTHGRDEFFQAVQASIDGGYMNWKHAGTPRTVHVSLQQDNNSRDDKLTQ